MKTIKKKEYIGGATGKQDHKYWNNQVVKSEKEVDRIKKELAKLKAKNIMYEGRNYWVLKIKDGFEVYRTGITHSTKVSQIGYTGEKGLNRAIIDCKNRENDTDNLLYNKKKIKLKKR